MGLAWYERRERSALAREGSEALPLHVTGTLRAWNFEASGDALSCRFADPAATVRMSTVTREEAAHGVLGLVRWPIQPFHQGEAAARRRESAASCMCTIPLTVAPFSCCARRVQI